MFVRPGAHLDLPSFPTRRSSDLFALGEAGVAAVRAALVTNARQPVGVDGQTEQLVLVVFESGGQLPTLHVVISQRVVGRADPVLQCHVKAGRGFPAARDTDQNDVRLLVVVGPGTVVVVHGEVHGIDAVLIVAVVLYGVGFAH